MTSAARPSALAVVDQWAGRAAVTALLGTAGLHLSWAHGRSWPLPDRESLARDVLGIQPPVVGRSVEPSAGPGRGACYAVAVALVAAAGLVSGRPGLPRWCRRWGLCGVASVLGARGVLGLAGRTDLVVPMASGAAFRRLDRRVYAPLCLAIAGAAALRLGHLQPGDPS